MKFCLTFSSFTSLDMPDTGSSEAGSKVLDPQHSQKLLRVLRTFWQEKSFHDALLVVDGEELPVQKNILAAASPYIRSDNLAVTFCCFQTHQSRYDHELVIFSWCNQCHSNMGVSTFTIALLLTTRLKVVLHLLRQCTVKT